MPELTIHARGEDETIAAGQKLAAFLPRRAAVLLIGNLGAGKTTLAKGIAQGLGVASADEVSSPTFPLIHEFGDPARLFHIDLYRLDTEEEVSALGLDEILDRDAITLIEWGERFPALWPADRWEIRIEPDEAGEARFITVRAWGRELPEAQFRAPEPPVRNEPNPEPEPPVARRRLPWRWILGVAAVASLGVAITRLYPVWSYHPGHPVLPRQTVALAGFRDLGLLAEETARWETGWIGPAATGWLAASLAGTRHLALPTPERVAAVRNQANGDTAGVLTRREVEALRHELGATVVIGGSYISIRDRLRFDVFVQDARTGAPLVLFSEPGTEEEWQDAMERVRRRLAPVLGLVGGPPPGVFLPATPPDETLRTSRE